MSGYTHMLGQYQWYAVKEGVNNRGNKTRRFQLLSYVEDASIEALNNLAKNGYYDKPDWDYYELRQWQRKSPKSKAVIDVAIRKIDLQGKDIEC